MSNGYQITEEERDTLVCPRLECMGAQELLDVWLLPLVLEVGSILEEAYCTSHQLFERGQGEERLLGYLQHQLMTAITELEVVQGWIASSCNMSSDKECRVLDGEEDKSEGKVLKEADQPANQQADCGKQKMCRCKSCLWRLRHE
jgi:hypothetical protein